MNWLGRFRGNTGAPSSFPAALMPPPMPAIKPARQDLSGLSIRKLDLRPGDRLVATYPGRLTHEQIHAIRQELERWAPGVKCAVVQQGVTIEVQPAQTPG